MRWQAIKRVSGTGPTHAVKEDGKTACGRAAVTKGNRFSEVWTDMPEPKPGELCIHCSAALGRAIRGKR